MFADRIRYLRQSNELTLEQLAQRLGVKKQSISNWEHGNIMPSIEMLERIADYFRVTTDYLLDREKPEAEGVLSVDVTGLTNCQIGHITLIIDDLRGKRDI